ncbi:MAG: hypothetical protein RL133_1046 [Pseudomonadota bacterium]
MRLPISPPSRVFNKTGRSGLKSSLYRMAWLNPWGPTMQTMNEPGLGQALHGGHHYENFPVASWLLPARMRQPMLALYAFARTGDDLADEGDDPPAVRLRALEDLRSGLTLLPTEARTPLSQIGATLAQACRAQALATAPAHALIDAFSHDAAFEPFSDWAGIADYCAHSANPVGRMVLGFAGLAQEEPAVAASMERASDAICSGLQLVNFAQDFGQDLGRNRPTLPQVLWPEQWSWDVEQRSLIATQSLSAEQQAGMTRVLARRGLELLDSARALPAMIRRSRLSGRRRLSLEIALTIAGGCAIGERVMASPLEPWNTSPKLSRMDMFKLIPRALVLWLAPGSEPTP